MAILIVNLIFPMASSVAQSAKKLPAMQETPGSGRPPAEGNGNPLQYSCLENPMDKGAWQATVHGVARVGHDLVTKPLPPTFLVFTHLLLYSCISYRNYSYN